jgi:hypothetical protein
VKLFFLILILLILSFNLHTANSESIEQSQFTADRSSKISKIHPILIQWQASENPDEFAKVNSLIQQKDKIAVYIHLDNFQSLSNIPLDIEVTASDDTTIAAFVNSEQLDGLSKLDFVLRVTPPDLAETPPIPKISTSQTEFAENIQPQYTTWIIAGGLAITTIIVIFLFKTRSRN